MENHNKIKHQSFTVQDTKVSTENCIFANEVFNNNYAKLTIPCSYCSNKFHNIEALNVHYKVYHGQTERLTRILVNNSLENVESYEYESHEGQKKHKISTVENKGWVIKRISFVRKCLQPGYFKK